MRNRLLLFSSNMDLVKIASDLHFFSSSKEEIRTAYIKKEDGKFCVKSEKNSDWSGGCYDTESEAKDRLKQIEMFKHMNK